MNHSCIASLRVIHASRERETLHNIPDLAISMACSHLCVLFSSCVYIHTGSSTGRLLLACSYAVITALMLAGRRPASGSGQPAEPFLHASHSCMLLKNRPVHDRLHFAFSALKWFEKVRGGSRGLNHSETVYRYPTHLVTTV